MAGESTGPTEPVSADRNRRHTERQERLDAEDVKRRKEQEDVVRLAAERLRIVEEDHDYGTDATAAPEATEPPPKRARFDPLYIPLPVSQGEQYDKVFYGITQYVLYYFSILILEDEQKENINFVASYHWCCFSNQLMISLLFLCIAIEMFLD